MCLGSQHSNKLTDRDGITAGSKNRSCPVRVAIYPLFDALCSPPFDARTRQRRSGTWIKFEYIVKGSKKGIVRGRGDGGGAGTHLGSVGALWSGSQPAYPNSLVIYILASKSKEETFRVPDIIYSTLIPTYTFGSSTSQTLTPSPHRSTLPRLEEPSSTVPKLSEAPFLRIIMMHNSYSKRIVDVALLGTVQLLARYVSRLVRVPERCTVAGAGLMRLMLSLNLTNARMHTHWKTPDVARHEAVSAWKWPWHNFACDSDLDFGFRKQIWRRG
ncbi:hypothetical protein C8R43DRAFT_963896 [Mycena crocata]|nr:hypothetical protein C8R43DRAFT_963896 [Mycena crocata]